MRFANIDVFVSPSPRSIPVRSEEHTSELQSQSNLVCRLLLEKKTRNPGQTTIAQTQQPPPAPPVRGSAAQPRTGGVKFRHCVYFFFYGRGAPEYSPPSPPRPSSF